ncbi:MAG: SLOG family protein [Porcipelethomonas sp.]
MTIIKEKTVCFTGHRPEKLPGGGDPDNPVIAAVKSMLYYQIYEAAEDGFEYFISGMARGIDIWAAQYVMEIKKKFPDIKLICAKPFEMHNNSFKGKDLWESSNILSHADDIICVSREYSKRCYRLRNYYMVDNSSRLIAVVDDYKSGTGQTIKYAEKSGLDVRIIKIGDYVEVQTGEKATDKGNFYFA